MVSVQRVETAPDADAVGTPAPGTGVKDHVLLVVKAMVNGTSVPALIDSGASRSFVSDRLRCQQPLQFVGAYSALELANGETIVSTGIAPRVLVCIGSIPCRLSLTAVPMMEGVQLILGKDWLDIMNPLVDWRSNTVYLRNGSQLEPIQGIRETSGTHCQIVDRGLSGLQHFFRDLSKEAQSPTADLEGQLALLQTPKFWSYEASTKQWVHQSSAGLSRKADKPQGGGIELPIDSPEGTRDPQKPQRSPGCKATRHRKVAGRLVKQPVKQKLDFISMRQAVKRANKTDQPMFLCVLKATDLPKENKKQNPKLVQPEV